MLFPFAEPESPAPPSHDHPNSQAAAESVAKDTPAMRAMILAIIRALGDRGATCFEVERLFGMRHQTASARLCELKRLGHVLDSGATRPSPSGRKAAVYVARIAS